MRLHALCHYRGGSDDWTDSWQDADYAARNVVKAVKGMPFNGSSRVKSSGGVHLIDSSPAGFARAMKIAGVALAKAIVAAGYENASVVPIPSSSHIDPAQTFTGSRLAAAIEAANPNLIAAPVLYFNQVLPKTATGGGSRNPFVIKQHLRAVGGLTLPHPCVLLDDVCTSGGHMIGAARFLADRGIQVADGFVVGRTARQRPENMFRVPVEELDTGGAFDF